MKNMYAIIGEILTHIPLDKIQKLVEDKTEEKIENDIMFIHHNLYWNFGRRILINVQNSENQFMKNLKEKL